LIFSRIKMAISKSTVNSPQSTENKWVVIAIVSVSLRGAKRRGNLVRQENANTALVSRNEPEGVRHSRAKHKHKRLTKLIVIPAKAGIHCCAASHKLRHLANLSAMDPGLRRDDGPCGPFWKKSDAFL
jgi:hypothetical protein